MKELIGVVFIFMAFLNLKRVMEEDDEEVLITPLFFDQGKKMTYQLTIYSFFDRFVGRKPVPLPVSVKVASAISKQYKNYYVIRMASLTVLGIFFIILQSDYRTLYFLSFSSVVVLAIDIIYKKRLYSLLQKWI